MELPGEIGQGLSTAFAQLDQATTLTTNTFAVSKDNVLAAAKIIQTQADVLHEKLRTGYGDLRVVPPGDDDVSIRIAPAWNDLLVEHENSYANRIKQYIDGLYKLARQCGDSAKAYGYTDEEVAAAFGGTRGA
ncbi:MAG: hypothetical protein ACJ72N_16270 [Labedaea sp.]